MVEQQPSWLDPTLAEDDTNVVDFMFHQVGVGFPCAHTPAGTHEVPLSARAACKDWSCSPRLQARGFNPMPRCSAVAVHSRTAALPASTGPPVPCGLSRLPVPPNFNVPPAHHSTASPDPPAPQYKMTARRQVRGKVERALAALREAQPDAAHLSVERDVLPKLEVRGEGGREGGREGRNAVAACIGPLRLISCACSSSISVRRTGMTDARMTRPPIHPTRPLLHQLLEGLSPGLGWKVFRDFPEQFGSPDALECWRLLAAYLFTLGIEPEQVNGWAGAGAAIQGWIGGV